MLPWEVGGELSEVQGGSGAGSKRRRESRGASPELGKRGSPLQGRGGTTDARGQDGGLAAPGWAFSGSDACTPRWSAAPAPFPALIWDKVSKEANAAVGTRRTQRRGRIRVARAPPPPSPLRLRDTFPCRLLPPSPPVFPVGFSACLAFWGLFVVSEFIVLYLLLEIGLFLAPWWFR